METKKTPIIGFALKHKLVSNFRLGSLFFLLLSLSVNVVSAQSNARDKGEDEGEVEQTMCGGTERWAQKVLVDADVSTINFTPISTTVNNLINIVTPTPSTSMPRYAGVEDKTYNVTCKITIKKAESDNDYHLVLSDGTHTLIGEIPDPACAAAASSAYVSQYVAARNFIDTYIGTGSYSYVNIAPVEVYGVAFVDPPHGQTGAAPNNLELHPILSIKFSTAGINTIQEKQLEVSVYPNPFKDHIQVSVVSKSANFKKCSLQLYDMMANKVAEFDLSVKGHKEISELINTTSVAPGTYIYRIVNDGKPMYDGKLISVPNTN